MFERDFTPAELPVAWALLCGKVDLALRARLLDSALYSSPVWQGWTMLDADLDDLADGTVDEVEIEWDDWPVDGEGLGAHMFDVASAATGYLYALGMKARNINVTMTVDAITFGRVTNCDGHADDER